MAGLDVWRAAREQLAAHEQRSAELGAALQAELDGLAAAEAEVKILKEARAEGLRQAGGLEGRRAAAAEQAGQLGAAVAAAERECGVLQKHIELLGGRARDLTAQMGADRQRFEDHLASLRSQLTAWRTQLAAAAV